MADPKEETEEKATPDNEKTKVAERPFLAKRQSEPRRPVPLLLIAVTLIAVAALGIALWSLFRTPAEGSASHSPEQAAEAKGRVCADFNTVRTAVSLQTHADLGRDRVAVQAVAANARLAMAAGGSYLLDRLPDATPSDLADAVRAFANGLEDIAINALAGVGNDDPAQAARLRDTQDASNRVAELCK